MGGVSPWAVLAIALALLLVLLWALTAIDQWGRRRRRELEQRYRDADSPERGDGVERLRDRRRSW